MRKCPWHIIKQTEQPSARRYMKPNWLTSLEAAATNHRGVSLLFFTGSDWCGWCKKINKEIFNTDVFCGWVEDEDIQLVIIDFPRVTPKDEKLVSKNDELMKKYNIIGYPTAVLVNSRSEELGQLGYSAGGPMRWVQQADAIVQQNPVT